jgi:uncharacterized damage-inducible protein DinB
MNNKAKFQPLFESSIHLCNQMQSIINQCDSAVYTKQITILSNATIGQHFRHIIEFYLELLNGIPLESINYENRQRDTLIETLPKYAVTKLQYITTTFNSLDLNTDLSLIARFSASKTEQSSTIKTSLARELMYAFDHAIHHLAIINIALQTEFPYIEIPNNLGVAPSTIRYREECVR